MKGQSPGSVRVSLLFYVFVRVPRCDEPVRVRYPCGVFRYIEPDDVALRVDTACLRRNHVCPWKVDGREVALSDQEAMSLIRRIDEESDDFAGGINVAGIRRDRIRNVEKLIVSVLRLVGVEGGGSRKDHADDNRAVPSDSVVHGARHGE